MVTLLHAEISLELVHSSRRTAWRGMERPGMESFYCRSRIKDTEGEQNNTVVSLRIEISQNTHAGGGEREIK